jgi:hypothetical protein
MRHFSLALSATLASLALAAPAHADPANYGIEAVAGSLSSSQAGAHADFTNSVTLKTEGGDLPALTRDVTLKLPVGLLANPTAVPQCTAAQFVSTDPEENSNTNGCPQDSQVGVTHIVFSNSSNGTSDFIEPVFNLEPHEGEPARLGFIALAYPILIDTELRPDYGVTAKVSGADTLAALFKTETTLWGVPADASHDGERMTPYEAAHNFGAIETPSGKRASSLTPVPYMLNPPHCGEPLPLGASTVSYQLPDTISEGSTLMPAATGCALLTFEPGVAIAPTTTKAETGSGLGVELRFPTDGFEHPNLLAEDDQRMAQVTLPEGMTVNPSESEGLGVCSEADFARETSSSGPDEGCPETSKIGTVSARSPLLSEEAEGSLFIAKPKENPFGTLIALYMTVKVPERGVLVKLAGKVVPDPETGQLVTTFGEAPYEIPQLPISSFSLHFREGARAPLVTPPGCGTYTSTATFTSWGGHTVTTHPSFQITSGVDGGPCPAGPPPFRPGFEAGTANNAAGSYSPFYMRLTRNDGDQDLTKFSATLPPGMVAKLAGASKCPDASIEAAKAKTGKEEQASPSCPAGSRIGHVLAGAGVGSVLTYVPGEIYLAGPFNGAPLSVVAIVPAVAGPFDVGTVVTRQALQLDPRTGVVTADGSRSDPIPHILAGIPLKVRDIRVYVDRPEFTLNPTSCDPMAVGAELWGGGIDVFSSLDDSPHSLSDRFQAANCQNLGFKPRLDLKLKGGIERGGHPALTGTYTPRAGDANLKGLVLRLPRSAFLDQGHIRTICTRVQFAADSCPQGAVYGHATAYTPLLDQPLSGPVYLRSSNHNLPDFVADLHGLVDVEAVARIDSKNGGIRASFSEVPDAPLSKVVVQMQGGRKGLIVNSTDLCAATHRANGQFEAQNGKRLSARPEMRAGCGG